MRQMVNGLFNREEIKILEVPIPPIETQRELVIRYEEERKLVESNKKLIEIYTQKIQDRINRVWGEN